MTKSKPATTSPTVDEMVKERRLLIIRWGDHWASPGWKKIDEHLTDANMDPFFCVSVGWEIARDERIVKLAQSLDENEKCAEVITILLASVISEEEIVFS